MSNFETFYIYLFLRKFTMLLSQNSGSRESTSRVSMIVITLPRRSLVGPGPTFYRVYRFKREDRERESASQFDKEMYERQTILSVEGARIQNRASINAHGQYAPRSPSTNLTRVSHSHLFQRRRFIKTFPRALSAERPRLESDHGDRMIITCVSEILSLDMRDRSNRGAHLLSAIQNLPHKSSETKISMRF